MRKSVWSVEDAKNRFGSVVEAARRGQPQTVTKRGKRAVVVVAAEEFDRLQRAELAAAPGFNRHLLAMPRGDGGFERLDGELREVEL